MTTEIVPVPNVVLASEFPTPADRVAGDFNRKAKEWADSENAMSVRNREIALTAHTNATAAQEQAQAANTARIAAQAAAADAQTAASAAAAAANATKWDSTTLYDEGAVVWSPIDMQTYRRREAGSGGVDPALDEDHIVWVPIAGGGGGSVRATTYQRTFSEGEERTITLEEPIEGAAIVSAQREVPQLDVQTNAWKTWLESEDFEYEDFARPVALTVGEEVDGMVTLTLASGEWDDVDVGRRVEGAGGVAVIQSIDADDATAFLLQAFDDSTVPAGQWALYGTSVHDGKLMLGTKAGAGYRAEDAEYVGQSPALNGSNNCLELSDDGLYLFKGPASTGSGGPFRYSLVSPFDVSNYTNSVQLPGFSTNRTAAVFAQGGTKLWGISASSGTLTVEERIMNTPWGTTHTAGITKTVTYVAGSGTTMAAGSAWLSPDGRFLYIGLNAAGLLDVHQFELLVPGDLSSLQNSTTSSRLLNIPATGASGNLHTGSADGRTLYAAVIGSTNLYAVRLPEPHDIANGVLDPDPIQVAPSSPVVGLTFGKNGQKMYSAVGATVYEYDINAAAIPTNQTYVSIYKSGIDTEFWTDARDLAVIEDSGAVYYAVSTDGRTTYYVTNRTDGLRPIARNNGGTWQVNTDATYTGETWVNAAVNDEHKALAEAVTHTTNQMTSKSLVLGRSWDLGSIMPGSLVENTALAQNNGTNLQNFRFQYAGDGSRFWALAATAPGASSTLSLKEYTPGAPWGVTAGAAVDKSLTVLGGTHDWSTANFCWSDDGHVFLLASYLNIAAGSLQLRRTAQAWRAAGLSAAADEELTQAQLITLMGGATPNIGCLCIAASGHRMYLADNTGRIHQFDMPTPYSIVGMTHAGSFPFTNATSATMRMSPDGKTAFVTSGNSQASGVRELSLAIPFDITSATLVATHTTDLAGSWMDFSNDGMYYYVMDAVSGQATAALRRVSMPPGNPPPLPELGDTMNMAITMRSENDNQGASTKGLSLTYDAHATNEGMTPGVDYTYHQPSPEKVQFKSNVAGNIRVRIV